MTENATHRGALGPGGSLLAGRASVTFRSGNPGAAGAAIAPGGTRGAILAWSTTDAWGAWVTLQTGPTFEYLTMKTLKILPSSTCIPIAFYGTWFKAMSEGVSHRL